MRTQRLNNTGALAHVAVRARALSPRIVIAIPAGAVVVLLAAALTDRFATGSPPPEPGYGSLSRL